MINQISLYKKAPAPKPPVAEAPKSKPAAAPSAKKAASKKASEPVQEVIEDVDDAVVADLYGKEHLNVVFMGHVGNVSYSLICYINHPHDLCKFQLS